MGALSDDLINNLPQHIQRPIDYITRSLDSQPQEIVNQAVEELQTSAGTIRVLSMTFICCSGSTQWRCSGC